MFRPLLYILFVFFCIESKSDFKDDVISAPYGIFARSCVAMAKDSKTTVNITDEHGYVGKVKLPSFIKSFFARSISMLHGA